MPYRRRSTSNRRRVVARDKYSVETSAGQITVNTTAVNSLYQGTANLVPSTTIQGMRKVKHLTIEIVNGGTSDYYWAVVYVPQGTSANALFQTSGQLSGSLYEPNQFVLACGLMDVENPHRINTPISRNLNSGDSISIVVGRITSDTSPMYFSVRYAVTLQ